LPDVDLFVIGAGSGGVACARRAATYGAKVAIAESSRVGGTCVIRGCVPKKLMHYSAHMAEMFKAAPGYGWELSSAEPVMVPSHGGGAQARRGKSVAPRLDFRRLIEARNAEIARLNGIYLTMLDKAGVRLFPGRAQILERNGEGFLLEVEGERITAARVLVATGAHPNLPEVPGIQHAITSNEILENMYEQPQRMAVIGAGYIGVELASIFAALGTDTTLVLRRDLPLHGFEEDLRRELTSEMQAHGLKLRTDTVIEAIERAGNHLRLVTSTGPMEVDAVVYSTGRDPLCNTRGIGLEALGVRMDRNNGAIYVNTHYESNVPGILSVGDCCDHTGAGMKASQHDLTPIAIAEGRNVAERLFNNRVQEVRYDTVPTAIFALPQAGSIGLTEERARALGHEVVIFRTAFRPMLHTLTGLARRTMMKLVVDKATDRVLGLHMVGDDAAEIVQGFAVAMTAGATKAQFDATVALHPTAAEELVTMYQPVVA
jgi:glutathione reductase (NADPH)